jgi:hypothetical protein
MWDTIKYLAGSEASGLGMEIGTSIIKYTGAEHPTLTSARKKRRQTVSACPLKPGTHFQAIL